MTPSRVAIAIVLTVGVVGCATTTVDEEATTTDARSEAEPTGGEDRDIAVDDTTPLTSGVIVDEGDPEPTLAVEGSPAELLVDIGTDMSRLGSEIADEGDEDATIATIRSTWTSIEPEVTDERPDLSTDIAVTIDMAQVAVDRNRPADADKAFSLLTDLIDSYTGDG